MNDIWHIFTGNLQLIGKLMGAIVGSIWVGIWTYQGTNKLFDWLRHHD